LWANKRNSGAVIYLALRILVATGAMPLELALDILLAADVLLGTGFAHNVLKNWKK